MARIPLPDGFEGSEHLPQSNKSLTNCYKDEKGNLHPRPGIDPRTTAGDETDLARGGFVFNDNLYAVIGALLYRIDIDEIEDTITPVSIGAIEGGDFNIESAVGFTEAVIIVNSATGPSYTLSAGEVLVETSGNTNFVPYRQVTYKDNRFFYVPFNGDPTQFSDPGDAGTIDFFSFIDAEQFPDKNVTTFTLNNILYIGGSDSFELFDATGDDTTPFLRKDGAGIDFGFIGGLQEYGTTFLFIGREKDQGPGIYALGAGSAERISNERIDLLLSTYTLDELAACIPGRVKWRNNDWATFTLARDSFGFLYGNWFILESRDGADSNPWEAGFIVQFGGIYYTFFGNIIGQFEPINTDYGETVTRALAFGVEQTDMKFFTAQSLQLGISQGFNPYSVETVVDPNVEFSGKFFDFSSQSTAPKQTAFSEDGAKMFMLAGTFLYEYNLTIAFDVDTASYTENSFNFSGEDSSPTGFAFSSDGTILQMVGTANAGIHQYTLSTAYEIDSMESDNFAFDISSEDNSPQAITYGDSGARIFIAGSENSLIYAYDLTTDHEIIGLNNVVYSGDSYNLEGAGTPVISNNPITILFNPTGTIMIVQQGGTLNSAYQWDLLVGFSFAAVNVFYSNNSDDSFTGSLSIDLLYNDTGSQLFVLSFGNGAVETYPLATNYELPTGALDNSWTIPDGANRVTAFSFNDDGTKIFIIGGFDNVNLTVREYDMDSAYDFSTDPTYTGNSFNISDQMVSARSLQFNTAGTLMIISDGGDKSGRIYQYELDTGFSLASGNVVYKNDYFSAESENDEITGQAFNDDGTKMFIVGGETLFAFEYDLTEPYVMAQEFDISYSGTSFDPSEQGESVTGITFDPNGNRMLLSMGTDNIVFQYDLAVAWIFESVQVTYSGESLDVSAETTAPDPPYDIEWNDDGSRFFILESSDSPGSGMGFQYNLTTNYDLSTATYSGNSIDPPVFLDVTYPSAFRFNDTGTVLFLTNYAIGLSLINQYNLTAPYDFSTLEVPIVGSQNFSFDLPIAFAWNSTGTKLFVLSDNDKLIYEFDLGTAFDLNGTFTDTGNTFDTTAIDNDISGIEFNDDGTKIFFTDQFAGIVYELDLTTAYSMATGNVNYNDIFYDTTAQTAGFTPTFSMRFNGTGSQMSVSGNTTQTVFAYNLESNYSFLAPGNVTYSGFSTDPSEQGLTVQSVSFNTVNGEDLYLTLRKFTDGSGAPGVYQYSLDIEFSIETYDREVNVKEERTVALRLSRDNVLFRDPFYRSTGVLGDYEKELIWNYPGGLGQYKFMGIEIFTTEDIIFSARYIIIDASGELQLG